MSQQDLFNQGFDVKSIGDFSEQAYLDYAMYVILDRALPFIGDGLKPVQRRIIYAMSELGLSQASKFKKSARTVGDVLGKFHPHGDSACYEAMVLMAQPFATKYPYIDGQGNWGSFDDPKSFAAMRYTESRLTKYAESLLAELPKGTVNFQPNFDGTLKEPEFLPAQLPNILLNGASGIAVGIATDILPHNKNEVIDALVYILSEKNPDLDGVLKHIKGPDFPTAGDIISSFDDIYKVYSTGQGAIKQRAKYSIAGNKIIIHTLPYQASTVKIIEQIAAQINSKKLPIITDIQDESDHTDPVRLVLTTKTKTNLHDVALHLFATTDLEKQYKANFNVIGLDKKPRLKNLMTILTEWLSFRKTVITRRLQFALDKNLARLHILMALIKVYANLDAIIKIIRFDATPKVTLMQTFGFDEIQVEAILNTKLRNLAKLEEDKLTQETNELNIATKTLQVILADEAKLVELLISELKSFKDDIKRTSAIVSKPSALILSDNSIAPPEPVTIILSQQGWIKSAKTHDIQPKNTSFKSLDGYLNHIYTYSNKDIYIYDSQGRFYAVKASSLPSARSFGEPLSSKVNLNGAKSVLSLYKHDDKNLILINEQGLGFKMLKLPVCKTKQGVPAFKLATDTNIAPVLQADYSHLAILTKQKRLLIIPIEQIQVKTKSTGTKLIKLEQEDYVVNIKPCNIDENLRFGANLKADELSKFVGNKSNKGKQLK